jgi:hypothetical protein
MNKVYCGLCGCEVQDWFVHVRTKEHQENLANAERVNAAHLLSQYNIVRTIEQGKGEADEGQNSADCPGGHACHAVGN